MAPSLQHFVVELSVAGRSAAPAVRGLSNSSSFWQIPSSRCSGSRAGAPLPSRARLTSPNISRAKCVASSALSGCMWTTAAIWFAARSGRP